MRHKRPHPLSDSSSSSYCCSGAAVLSPSSSSTSTLVAMLISFALVVSVANMKWLTFPALWTCTCSWAFPGSVPPGLCGVKDSVPSLHADFPGAWITVPGVVLVPTVVWVVAAAKNELVIVKALSVGGGCGHFLTRCGPLHR